MSDVVTELIRLGLRREVADTEPRRSARGMPLIHVGHPVTAEDVRSLDDDS